MPISPAKRPPVRSISMPAVGSPPKRRGSKPSCPQPLSVRVATDLDSEQEQAEHKHPAERSLERLHPLERLAHGEEAEARRLLEKAMGSVGNRRMAAEGTKSLQLPANRGKPQLVRALASHKKDHWAKLQFREGELLLSYPEAPTGDPLWCMGQNSRGDAGLFYEKDFVTPLDCSPLEKELERLERAQTEAEEGEKSEEEAPALRGWLWKKGYWGLRKSFKKRWFVLKIAQMRLYYFVNKEDEKAGTCRGFIDIKEVTTVHETFYFRTRKKKGDWPFEVHTPDREWLLKADSEETMLKWISKLNGLAHYQDHKRLIDEFRVPAARPKALSSGEGASINGPAPPGSGGLPGACEEPAVPSVPKDDDDEFATFGAPFGEEVTNKHTILGDLDKFLGSREPPAVEYVFVEPYLNFARKTGRVFGRWQITLNPYGHAVVRYTLPGTKEQVVMNIVGLAGEELVNFLPPEEFFFGTNFDIKTGNEQGGLYNRNFVSVRVQRVPDERVLAMHQYFLDLANRAHKEKVNYNVIFGPVLNMLGGTMYGNCAYWCSKGLNQVGLVNTISMIPKAIWIDMYELLKANNQQDRLSANTTVVYYKRCLHAKRFYGADADWAGWGRTPSTKYDDLIQLADAVVEIPVGTKTAVVRPGPVRIEEQRRAHAAILKAGAAFSPKIQLTCEVGRRVLYNDYFQRCLDASSLRPLDRSAAETSEEGEGGVRLLSVGCPPWTNSWRVDKAGQVYRSEGRANEPESGSWVPVKAPVAGACTCIEAGEDGSCWAVFGKELFVRKDDADEWQAVPPPEEAADITAISYVTTALVWVLDARGAAFKWKAAGHRWVRVASAPPLACLSCGADGEVWAVGKDHRVYRRMAIAAAAAAGALSCHQPHAESGSDSNAEDVLVPSAAALADSDNDTWVEIHGALLKSVSVATAEEVWGVDPDGQAFVWSRQTEQTLPYGKRLIGGKVVEDLARNALGKGHRHWQALGNVQPLSRVSVTSDGTAWAVGKFSRSAIYRLSPHRLVLTTTLSTRKIWDDRKSGARPFQIGYGASLSHTRALFSSLFSRSLPLPGH